MENSIIKKLPPDYERRIAEAAGLGISVEALARKMLAFPFSWEVENFSALVNDLIDSGLLIGPAIDDLKRIVKTAPAVYGARAS